MNPFMEMRDWYENLSPQEKAQIDEIKKKVGAPPRGTPFSHGDSEQDQLRAAIGVFEKSPEPRCLVRVGDTDIALLSGGAVLFDDRPVSKYLWHSGIDHRWFRFRPEFIEMAQSAPMYGIHTKQSWCYPATATETILAMLGVQVPNERCVVIGTSYYLLTSGTLFKYIEGKRVLLVGESAPRISAAWYSPSFIEGHSHFGPLEKTRIVGALPCAPRADQKDPGELDQIMEQVKKTDFDVALISAGGMGKLVAWRIWRDLKRTALDLGACFNALIGGHRDRGIFNTVKWPEVKW